MTPSTITVREGPGLTTLAVIGIDSVTLCRSHMADCVELIVNYSQSPCGPLQILERNPSDDGEGVVLAIYTDEDGTVELFIPTSGAGIKLLTKGTHYSLIEKHQEQILFVPFPETKADWKATGSVIATTQV